MQIFFFIIDFKSSDNGNIMDLRKQKQNKKQQLCFLSELKSHKIIMLMSMPIIQHMSLMACTVTSLR